MTVVAFVLGALFLVSGSFTSFVGALALFDAYAAVRVRRTTIARRIEGYSLIRGSVDAVWGSVVAPYSGLPAVFARTRVAASTASNPSHGSAANVVGLWEERRSYVVADATGTIDVRSTVNVTWPVCMESGPLVRLPERVEDEVHRRYGNTSMLRPPGGHFHVTEESLIDTDDVWLLLLCLGSRHDTAWILCASTMPMISGVEPDTREARALGFWGAFLLVAAGMLLLSAGR